MPTFKLCCCFKAVQENLFGDSAQNTDVSVAFDGQESRLTVERTNECGIIERLCIYRDEEPIKGKVNVGLRKPKLDHQGILIELIGEIETCHEKGGPYVFSHASHELSGPGEIRQNTSYNFEFVHIKRPYETYAGINVKLRYFLRTTITRRLSDIVSYQEILIHSPSLLPEVTRSVKSEIGIGDTLHIEMECNKWKYHLMDVINGSIKFLKVGTEISSVVLQIIKREQTTVAGQKSLTENEVVASFEVLDGTPKNGDCLPIRLFLSSYRLTPTMRNIEERFTIKYYLNLVITDEEDNKYFKQQEITIYRRDEKRTNSWKKQTKSLISSLPIHLKQQPMMTMNSDDDAGLNDGCCPSSVKVTFENDVKVNSLTSDQ